MKRILSLMLVLLLGVCIAGQAETLPETIERSVPLEGVDEARTYDLVPFEAGGFSIYIDKGYYEAVENEDSLTIQEIGGGVFMTLTSVEGTPEALRQAFVTPEMESDDSFWEEEFEEPVPGCGVYFSEGEKARSVYWFDAGNGKSVQADFALLPEEQEGHGVRMWDMLETLVFD